MITPQIIERRDICPEHSAKTQRHSAKGLPRAPLGKGLSGKPGSAKEPLPRAFPRALGKEFTESQKRLSAKKSGRHGAPPWTDPLPSVTVRLSAKDRVNSYPGRLLSRVPSQEHSAKRASRAAPFSLFAESHWSQHSAKLVFFLITSLFSLPPRLGSLHCTHNKSITEQYA
jgi:hypothetical protein